MDKVVVNAKNCLQDKVILITGAGSGIGRSVALEAAAFGAHVILLGRTVAKLEAVYDEILRLNYLEPVIYPLDLIGANPKDYQELAENIYKTYGKLNGIVHNAGYLGSLTPLELFDEKEWYKVQQTNLNAPFMLNKALLPLLKAQKKSTIIFTSIEERLLNQAYFGAYAISYSALKSMAFILAQEVENYGIMVNILNPGKVLTPLRARAYPAENVCEMSFPAQITANYIYLLSDIATVTGQVIKAKKAFSKYESDVAMQLKVVLV